MSIKLIAVDMDGTFLSDQKTYNRERFMAQYQQNESTRHSLCGRQRESILSVDLFLP